MASATQSRTEAVSLEYGKPEFLTLKYTTGKNIGNSKQPPFLPRVMFSTEEGPVFLDAEDGSEVEAQIRDLGIRAGDPIVMTKIKHPRGGGHSYRVARPVSHNAPEPQKPVGAPYVSRGPARPMTDEEAAALFSAPDSSTEALLQKSIQMARTQPPAPQVITPAAMKLMACFMQSIDAISEAQAYCRRKDLGITFTSEDVRATAISCWISSCKDGGR